MDDDDLDSDTEIDPGVVTRVWATRSATPSDATRNQLSDLREHIDLAELREEGYVVLEGIANKYLGVNALADIHRDHPIVHDLDNGLSQQQQTDDGLRIGGR